MQTNILPDILATPEGQEADRILRSCVHCGFCTATCPTYQVLGDELDSPRGRIYLIKEMLEGAATSEKTRLHLDRCLTCQACETTCPSGVEYHKLLTIGRQQVEQQVPRSLIERNLRWTLRQLTTRRRIFALALRLGQLVKPLLPARLKSVIPARQKLASFSISAATQTGNRKVILLQGCVQPALAPNINQSTKRVLDALGIETLTLKGEGCCGALSHHMNATDHAIQLAKANIDAWWPHIEAGEVEAIIISESGCGNFVKQYIDLLKYEPHYAEKISRLQALTKDISEVLNKEDLSAFKSKAPLTLAFQSPCTLQHGQKLQGSVEKLLTSLGHTLTVVPDAHLCCGSAGTYSILQRDLSLQLRSRKLDSLHAGSPTLIATANIGCLAHLRAGTDTPVKHWIEMLADELD